MKQVDLWIAFSQQAVDEFKARRADEEGYSGPMDDDTYKLMRRMQSQAVRERMFAKPTIGGKTYTSFNITLSGNLVRAKEHLDDLEAKWPSHFIVLGAFWFDTGLQVGVSYVLDSEGVRIVTNTIQVGTRDVYVEGSNPPEFITEPVFEDVYETTGTPVYPIPAQAWKLMPPEVGATDNAGLKDLNLIMGQAPRIYS